MSKRVPDRIQIRSSDKPSNTVNTFWGLCKNPRAKHGGNSSSFRCVPEQFVSSLSCVLDLAVEVVHSSHIPGSGLPGNQAVDQIQSGLGQFQAQNSKSFLDFSHTTLYWSNRIMVLRSSFVHSVLPWQTRSPQNSPNFVLSICPEINWRSFQSFKQAKLSQNLTQMLACHLNILAHRTDTKQTWKHLTQQNHLELALNQTQKEEIHLNFKHSLTLAFQTVWIKRVMASKNMLTQLLLTWQLNSSNHANFQTPWLDHRWLNQLHRLTAILQARLCCPACS